MTTIFKTAGKSFRIKENQSSWTVTRLEMPDKLQVTFNYSKVEFPTIEDVKNKISNIYEGEY